VRVSIHHTGGCFRETADRDNTDNLAPLNPVVVRRAIHYAGVSTSRNEIVMNGLAICDPRVTARGKI